ncbi:MAG: ribonuclease III [Oscillospiraceae bacterium]|nr:ribonuclease III [Oscillospiraceae bacterium]
MQKLQKEIGYVFQNPELLRTAFTHSSWVNEHPNAHAECYERLEFLGDAILDMVTAEKLYRCEPALPEGRMTRIRSKLVCEESLYHVAQTLELGRLLRLGRGEERSDGRQRVSVLADLVEAVIAAIFLDGGLSEAERFIESHVLKNAETIIRSERADPKTELQELIQRVPGNSIEYRLLSEDGPDHDKCFRFAVYLNGIYAGEGTGKSKKEAEQAAAGAALEKQRA